MSRKFARKYRGMALYVSGVAVTVAVTTLALPPAHAAGGSEACVAGLNAASAPEGGLETEFRILSWNIKKASHADWASDFTTVADGADLVFIQEASLQAGIASYLTDIEAEAFAPGYRTASLDTGVMTLSSEAHSLHCSFSATEPWLRTPKATSITEYAIQGRDESLLAINLHAVNFAMGLSDFEGQFAEIGSVLARHSGPVVVAGDLNTWSQSRQALVDQFMAEHGLEPVRFEPDLRTTAFGRALDHIYVRGLQAESATVVPVESSDHNPLQVQLRIDS